MQEIDATGIEGLPMSHTVNGYGDISHSSVRSGTMLDPASEGEKVATIEHLLKRRTAVRHILRLRLQGKSRKEIAAILGKSPHTIDWHLRELMRSCRPLSLARIVVIIASSPRLTALLSSADSPPGFGGLMKAEVRP